jgi:Outer membrane protein beta-barrel domain
MRPGRVLLLALALSVATALADAAPRRAASARGPSEGASSDIFGGYSYTHAGEASLNGWGLSGSYRLRGALSLVAGLSGHYGSFAGASLGQLGFMAGARWSGRAGPFRPFAEGLLGGVRTSVDVGDPSVSDADTDWGFAFGGGADYPFSRRWAVRGLVHLRLLHGQGTWDTDPRFSVGVVYRLRR